MGLQAVNETTQAHGCWTASISMPPLTHLSRGVRTEGEWLKHETCPQPIMSFLVASPEILSCYGKRPVFFCSISIIPVWNVRKGGQGISHKKWREEGRLNERIKEGGRGGTKRGQAAVTKQAEKGNGAQTRLDCLSWSAALLWGSREVKGQSLMMLCSSAEFYRTVNFTVD